MNVIYARVSTKEQSELEQIPKIKEAFNLDGSTLVLKEEVSAWKIDKEEKRLELIKLKELIKRKQVTKLYIWDLDRLYRNRKKTREFFELCAFKNVEIYSVNQKWLNDFQELKKNFPNNFKFLIDNIHSLLLDVYAQTSEDESTKKSERVKLKITKNKEGVTTSTLGKKWGRRKLPKHLIEKVLELKDKLSIRDISKEVYYYDKNNNKTFLSVGSVHKIITQNKANISK